MPLTNKYVCDGQMSIFDLLKPEPKTTPKGTMAYPCSDCTEYQGGCIHGIDPRKCFCKEYKSKLLNKPARSECAAYRQYSSCTGCYYDKAKCPYDRTGEYAAGQWVEKEVLGEELTFEEITHEVGKLIIISAHTESHKWYKVVKVESIVMVENNTVRRLVYYDGHRDRGLINEYRFKPDGRWPSHAYRIKEESN